MPTYHLATNSKVKIAFQNAEKPVRIVIKHNSSGKVIYDQFVYHQANHSNMFNLEKMKKGTYKVMVINQGKVTANKYAIHAD